MLVDPYSANIRQFDPDGRSSILTQRFTAVETFAPVEVKPTAQGLLFQLKGGRFVEMTEHGRLLGDQVTLNAPIQEGALLGKSNAGGQIRGIWQWALAAPEFGPDSPASPQDVFAFAEIFAGGSPRDLENWTRGFVRYPMDKPGKFAFLRRQLLKDGDLEIGTEGTIRTSFRFGYPLIAFLGSTAYALVMEEEPRLYASVKGSESLKPVNLSNQLPGLQKAPDLSFGHFPSEYPSMMEVLTFGGLYVQGDTLYYLSRKASEAGDLNPGATWAVTALRQQNNDPFSLVVGEPRVISGLSASQTLVVPGPEDWAFIEKGAIKSHYQPQEIFRMYLVPRRQIEGSEAICSKIK